MNDTLLSTASVFTMLQIQGVPDANGTPQSQLIAIGISVLTGVLVPTIKDWFKTKIELWRKKKGLKNENNTTTDGDNSTR
jgi:hypothetical protein